MSFSLKYRSYRNFGNMIHCFVCITHLSSNLRLIRKKCPNIFEELWYYNKYKIIGNLASIKIIVKIPCL